LEYTGNLGKEKQSIAWLGGEGVGDDGERGDVDDGGGGGGTMIATNNAGGDDGGNGGDEGGDGKEEIFVLDTLAVERERGITVKGERRTMKSPFSPHSSMIISYT
jgi:hypothetical protein